MTNIPYYPDIFPIVFSSNDYYVPYMSTNMQSIMENAKNNKKYCFFILYRDISEEYMDLIKKQISVYNNFSIYFINVTEYFNGVNFFISRNITVETYFRLLIPYIFSEYNKILYLDGDMICLTDISYLFSINLENYMLAAVWDTDVSRYYCPDDKEYIKSWHKVLPNLKEPNTFFNGGLILFNTPFFRENITIENLLNISISKEWNIHDQDILNFLTDGKNLVLPYIWNYTYSPKAEYLPENMLTEYNDAKKSPNIIHFTKKPWDGENYIPYFEYFWKYATRTPFITVIVKRMNDKRLISFERIHERILANIINRKGIGLRFILLDCIKAWLHRDKN